MQSKRHGISGHTRGGSRDKIEAGGTLGAVRQVMDGMIEKAGNDKRFAQEMNDCYDQIGRYLQEKKVRVELDWEKVKSPKPEYVLGYKTLKKVGFDDITDILSKLVVLKLNGGLGTTMGCVGPKSAIEVRDGQTFLDLTVQQIEYINTEHNVDVPLILMNSFNTHDDTDKIIKKYANSNVPIYTFNQSQWPRIKADTSLPITTSKDSPTEMWYPPGHGDLYKSFYNCGMLQQLIDEGKEWVFVSNVDNLGATVDPVILRHLANTDAEYIMEVTDKTKADIKGGTIIDYDGQIRLLEIAQVPKEHQDDFKRVKKFKIFNTNNLWINLKSMKRLVEEDQLQLDLIINKKATSDGTPVIQLETAVGAAIKYFDRAHGINVPRSRFLPVKSTSDLFLVTSNLYIMENGYLRMNPARTFSTAPIVKLGDHFKKVKDYLARFKTPPQILELDHLSVTGDVFFGANVTLTGTVIVVANHGAHIDIPRGAVLNDKVVSGDLRILDH
ncbi:UTP-glucose-1-phosphate uridylyltransferase [Zancudomyces culisetae]|uniref:UTP--glucose-1-phosphate uridylyltransferase n=1 Tax=Zancudomyces culisetae TaxID=1213189 RepID=A0A1R1PU14_ZANCU|nr:UTP-glucose-1-phosphate uridylyltransferase [Zancudomyces culisetae]|eukprot:OMH84409.1 UTP-glucose-1-phosphate uridylyltransferase [Zancudomyces culisetae]